MSFITTKRQHQKICFPIRCLLAFYDYNLLTRVVHENSQTLTKGAIFGPTSSIDIEKATEFIRQCNAAAAPVKRLPPLP